MLFKLLSSINSCQNWQMQALSNMTFVVKQFAILRTNESKQHMNEYKTSN